MGHLADRGHPWRLERIRGCRRRALVAAAYQVIERTDWGGGGPSGCGRPGGGGGESWAPRGLPAASRSGEGPGRRRGRLAVRKVGWVAKRKLIFLVLVTARTFFPVESRRDTAGVGSLASGPLTRPAPVGRNWFWWGKSVSDQSIRGARRPIGETGFDRNTAGPARSIDPVQNYLFGTQGSNRVFILYIYI